MERNQKDVDRINELVQWKEEDGTCSELGLFIAQ